VARAHVEGDDARRSARALDAGLVRRAPTARRAPCAARVGGVTARAALAVPAAATAASCMADPAAAGLAALAPAALGVAARGLVQPRERRRLPRRARSMDAALVVRAEHALAHVAEADRELPQRAALEAALDANLVECVASFVDQRGLQL